MSYSLLIDCYKYPFHDDKIVEQGSNAYWNYGVSFESPEQVTDDDASKTFMDYLKMPGVYQVYIDPTGSDDDTVTVYKEMNVRYSKWAVIELQRSEITEFYFDDKKVLSPLPDMTDSLCIPKDTKRVRIFKVPLDWKTNEALCDKIFKHEEGLLCNIDFQNEKYNLQKVAGPFGEEGWYCLALGDNVADISHIYLRDMVHYYRVQKVTVRDGVDMNQFAMQNPDDCYYE